MNVHRRLLDVLLEGWTDCNGSMAAGEQTKLKVS